MQNKDGMWCIPNNGFEFKKSPCVNIHYNSEMHWVTSFQYENGDVYLLDSNLEGQSKVCIYDSLNIQLAQIYGCGKSNLTIKIPRIQQQNNSYDCSLFSIANMEFVSNRYHGLQDGKPEFVFVQSEMRKHLKKSLSQNIWNHFQKKSVEWQNILILKILL